MSQLARLVAELNPDASLASRHLWLGRLVQWLRGSPASTPEDCAGRVQQWLVALQAVPDGPARMRQWWRVFVRTVDPAPLLADYGFAPRTSFLSEFGRRLRRKLLPATPETTDAGHLFDLLQPGSKDAQWLRALDDATLVQIQQMLTGDVADGRDDADDPSATTVLLNALTYSVTQVAATGFASEIRLRMSADALRQQPFHALLTLLDALKEAVHQHGPLSSAAVQAAAALRAQLDVCRHAAYTVYSHLQEHGISVGIVFRLRQLRERVIRSKNLIDCLVAPEPMRPWAGLLADLALAGQEGRSLRALITSSTHLTAARVAERSAESGEHYITRNRAEYTDMLGKAAGGGLVLALTTWVKFLIYALGLSAFWAGFAAGLNYATSFVVIMLLHWTVATKQPAVTAPAMAARLRDMSAPGAQQEFVDEVAHLLRSQMAAIIGNLGLVIPGVLLICVLLALLGLPDMLSQQKAMKVLHEQSLLGPTALFAALTGVLLFASSIIAGWVENWFVQNQLDSAMAWNPRITHALGVHRARRWAGWLRQNISGLAANISLGLLLGLVPAFAEFFGLGLQVRHVTLSTGQVAAAAFTLGAGVWYMPQFWWAVAGIAVIGPLNLAVSFYMAFRLALAAKAVSGVSRKRLAAAIRTRLREAPLSFVLPPRHAPADTAQAEVPK